MEPPVKKAYDLRRDDRLFNSLVDAAVNIDRGFSDMNALFLEIEWANAAKCTSFSRAACCTTEYPEESTLAMGALFRPGMEVLRRYVETSSDKDCLPEDELAREALKKLVTFFYEDLPAEFLQPDEHITSECEWAVLLVQHLLSKLTLATKYTINQNYQDKFSLIKHNQVVCPCPKNELLVGEFGDTSFGCPDGWHGNVDILIDNELPVYVTSGGTDGGDTAENDDKCSVVSDISDSSVEVDKSDTFTAEEDMQMISQAIVFSLLQRKNCVSLKNSLIPLLGISKSKLKIYFYDSENDILLKSEEMSLTTSPGELDYGVVVLLWLTLNYKLFCSGVPDDMKHYKAKFRECVGETVMQRYKQGVQMNVAVQERETRVKRKPGRNPFRVFRFPRARPTA